MKALAVIPRSKHSLHVRSDVPDPSPGGDEVVVRVLEAGVCGTDFEINDGQYGRAPAGSDYLILGHENLGVVETAPGGGLAVGDLVVATVRRPCPERCEPCAAGQNDMCRTGHFSERGIEGLHGFMSERYVEDPRYLVRVPARLRPFAILLEPLSVVEKGVEQAYRIQQRMPWTPKKAVVLGAGTVGLLAAALLRVRGLETFVVGREPHGTPREAFLSEIGLQYVSTADTPLETLALKTGPADVVVEATGAAAVVAPALSLQARDGIAVLASVTGGERRFEVDVAAWNRQMVLGNQVAFGTVNAARRHFEAGLADMDALESRHPGWLARIVTRRLPFEDVQTLLARDGGDIKTVLEFS
jgi:threonine dehydrogenase-like Zn-dependent dehydrogenase